MALDHFAPGEELVGLERKLREVARDADRLEDTQRLRDAVESMTVALDKIRRHFGEGAVSVSDAPPLVRDPMITETSLREFIAAITSGGAHLFTPEAIESLESMAVQLSGEHRVDTQALVAGDGSRDQRRPIASSRALRRWCVIGATIACVGATVWTTAILHSSYALRLSSYILRFLGTATENPPSSYALQLLGTAALAVGTIIVAMVLIRGEEMDSEINAEGH